MKKKIIILLVLFSTLLLEKGAFGAIIVGRISHVEGQIYRYLDAGQTWVETFAESPAGTQDVLAAGNSSRAEIVFPNNILVQLDENAEIEILNLEEDTAEFFLPTGLARFYNRSAAVSMTVNTARGTAKVGPGCVIDMRVDGNMVVVAAVRGTTTFQAAASGNVEVLSGSSVLEFHVDSILSGIGPINRYWNSWCLGRENVWSQKQLVRSEYLPETMQEYAYVLEPHGNWHRIYYRGYYYWAWQPSNVAPGWAPYTTGYWYGWQGDSVWIDHNPWGWVTHHHGYWLHMHGAWMWTPYVHVSNIPGVTVVGFNITFGREYRSNWHPGRVRWITHSGYIGWLPLAPWETYYGYRRWGPRSMLVQGGPDFQININLADHKHVDHAVIIPKRYFHHQGRLVINNYNTVRIRNINKTKIIKKYRPVAAMVEQHHRKHETRSARTLRAESRTALQTETRVRDRNRGNKVQKQIIKDGLVYRAQKPGRKKMIGSNKLQTLVGKYQKENDKRRDVAGTDGTQKRVASFDQKTRVKKIKNQGKRELQSKNGARADKQRPTDIAASNKQRVKKSRQANVLTSSKTVTGQKNAASVVQQNSSEERRQARRQMRVAPRQNQQGKEARETKYKENSREYSENDKRKEGLQGKNEKAGFRQHNSRQDRSRERSRGRRQPGRGIVSASLNNRSFR